MCGISGIVSLDLKTPASVETLESMLDVIVHRGPDDRGLLDDKHCVLGMNRLAIIDIADGQQPIFDESGRYVVVCNGEIYNAPQLRQELKNRGHQFRSRSDVEVIVHLFEEQGIECVKQLRGMFALAVWDRQQRQLLLARDRLGIKPLYYAIVGGQLVFGSEIKSLLCHPSVPRELDHHALSQYVSLKYVAAPRTLFKDIRSLEPGCMLTFQDRTVRQQKYWNLSFAKPDGEFSETDSLERLEALMRESVRLRLQSDVPFGAFLSGGLDSSLIVALMAQELSQPIRTFSVGFDGVDGNDELPYAKTVAEKFGCDHQTIRVNAQHFTEYAEQVLWHLDQPIADQATVATYLVARLASQRVKMVLTGEGGDELFAGYARYSGEQFSPRVCKLPVFARRALLKGVRRMPGMRRACIAASAWAQSSEAARLANWFPMFADDLKRDLLSGWSGDVIQDGHDVFATNLAETDARDSVDRMLYCDSKAWLPDYLLLRGDKLTMANSLEGRVPLLDHHLVEFAASLPADMKLRGRTRKYALKRVAEKWLPDSIVHRQKQGFPIPIDRWLRNEARELVQDNLNTDSIRARGLFAPQFVERIVDAHMNGHSDFATEIWGLVSFEMWCRKFLDGPASFRDAKNTSNSSDRNSAARHRHSTSSVG